MLEDRSPPVMTRRPLCGSLASGPTTAAHLNQEAATQREADAQRYDERDEGTINRVGTEQPNANRQGGHDAGGNLPRVADDEVVAESQEPDEEAHDSMSPRLAGVLNVRRSPATASRDRPSPPITRPMI